MPDLRPVEQLGMDERVLTDKALEALLEKRLRLKDDAAEVRKAYRSAHEDAKEAIAKHDLAEGDVVRVGRFRIAKRPVAARHVEFDAEATERLTIELWADE